jgi:hypothetical protein
MPPVVTAVGFHQPDDMLRLLHEPGGNEQGDLPQI